MVHFAHNLRRLMAQFDLTVIDVAERTGLDDTHGEKHSQRQ